MHFHQKLSKDIPSNYEHGPGAFPDDNTHNGPIVAEVAMMK